MVSRPAHGQQGGVSNPDTPAGIAHRVASSSGHSMALSPLGTNCGSHVAQCSIDAPRARVLLWAYRSRARRSLSWHSCLARGRARTRTCRVAPANLDDCYRSVLTILGQRASLDIGRLSERRPDFQVRWLPTAREGDSLSSTLNCRSHAEAQTPTSATFTHQMDCRLISP